MLWDFIFPSSLQQRYSPVSNARPVEKLILGYGSCPITTQRTASGAKSSNARNICALRGSPGNTKSRRDGKIGSQGWISNCSSTSSNAGSTPSRTSSHSRETSARQSDSNSCSASLREIVIRSSAPINKLGNDGFCVFGNDFFFIAVVQVDIELRCSRLFKFSQFGNMVCRPA